MGCYLFVVQIFVGESSSINNRGCFLNFIHIFIHSGAILVYTIGYFLSHLTLNIILASIPILYAIGFQFLVESPPFLIKNGKLKEAEHSLYRLRDCKKTFEDELIELRLKSLQNFPKKSFKELFKIKSTRKATIIMCTQFFFFQMSGFNAIKFYAQSIFMNVGNGDIHPGVASIIYATVLASSACFASIFANKIDRRIMLCTFNFICAISLSFIGAYFNKQNWSSFIPLLAVCVYSCSFSLGTASVTWTLLGELFTIEAKKIFAPLAQVINHGFTFLIVLTYPSLVDYIGSANIFYIFAGATFMDIVFTYFFIPETRGKNIDEIQNELKK